jgi:hypothetical protein
VADFLAAIERLPPVEALRASFVAYPLVNAVHIATVGILLASLLFMHGRIAGLFPAFSHPDAETTFRRVALLAFGIAALTGIALFTINAREYAANPAFLVKLLLLVLAGANLGLYLANVRWRKMGAIASIILWPAVLIAGRFIGFV